MQVAITGADWLPRRLGAASALLLLLCLAKIIASSLTIGIGRQRGRLRARRW